jgi:flagellar FliL protein
VSANAPAAPAKEKTKSKKMLVIIIVVVALLVVAGGAAAWFLSSRAHPKDDEAAEEPAPAKEASKTPPTFLPMDNMVVNLADPGGERFAQIGITLEVVDAKTADQVKQYLPSIRSGILMLVSQRTSGELLQREGKEKLANDILREVSKPLGFSVPVAKKRVAAEGEEEDPEERAARRKADKNPVKRVLFSSFIIQ